MATSSIIAAPVLEVVGLVVVALPEDSVEEGGSVSEGYSELKVSDVSLPPLVVGFGADVVVRPAAVVVWFVPA